MTGVTGWVWALPGAGPFSQGVVVAVCNDVTVAVENFGVYCSFGLVPVPPGVTVAIENCPHKVSPKHVFLGFWGPGGTPT